MKYMIGMDSGGSKTETILFDETGRVIVRDLDVGANAMDIGKEAAQNIIMKILNRVIPQSPGKVCEVFGGMVATSLGDFMVQHMRKNLPEGTNAHVVPDGGVIISGMLGHNDGCSMISGTGASMFIRRGEEPLIKIGGWGTYIDTDGSGFGLGKDALCYAFRERDCRGRKTLITELVRERVGEDLRAVLTGVYGDDGRAYVARFAGTVIEARNRGDELACELYEKHTDALASMTYAAERFFDGNFSIVMNGGIFQNFPEYRQTVIDKSSPKVEMIMSSVPPVYGAVVEAMWYAGVPLANDFKENFMSSYLKAKENG